MRETLGRAEAAVGDPRQEQYCVVGPSVALTATRAHGSDTVTFDVLGDRGVRLGALHTVHERGVVKMRPDPSLEEQDEEVTAESVRLAVRTLAKTHRDGGVDRWEVLTSRRLLAHLARDGFAAAGGMRLRAGRTDLMRGRRQVAADMEEVYADPYTVPWNFVPLESDVLERMTAGVPAGASVLDLGCGYGKNARLLASLGYRVTGSDISSSAVSRARALLGDEAEVVVADAGCLPWPDATFDAALDIGCLHCMPSGSRDAAVRELARVLTPEGVLHSRMFRPRPTSWVAEQPFRTDAFGLEPEAAAALLRTAFSQVVVDSTPHATHLTARGPMLP